MEERRPEYVQKKLMRGIGAITAQGYGETAPRFVPTSERLETTASSLNTKVQTARRALAEVAIAIGDANELIAETGFDFEQGKPVAIAGIDDKVLKFLDSLDAKSAPERTDEEPAPQELLDTLEWFDAIDDGTPKHLVTRRYSESASGQSGYNSEHRTVTHDIMRREGDVYIHSQFSWSTNDWRALSKAENRASETYVMRRPDGSFSPALVTRFAHASSDHNDGVWPTSPLFSTESTLLPISLKGMAYNLKEFKRAYTVQSRMASTLSLLGALPAERGRRSRGLPSYDPKGSILTEHNLELSDGRSFGVTAYGEHGQPVEAPSYVGIQDNKNYLGFGIDCEEWRIHGPDQRAQSMGITTVLIDEVNIALRQKLLAGESTE